MIDDSMKEIVDDFVQEALELLESLNENFVELEKDPENKELLNTIFRAAHTIKGSAGFLGFQNIVELAHSAENILNRLRQGEIKLTSDMMDYLLKAIDALKVMIVAVSETGTEGDALSENEVLIKQLNDTAEGKVLQKEEPKDNTDKTVDAKTDANMEIESRSDTSQGSVKTDKKRVRNLGDILLEDNLISKEELEQIYKEKEEEERKQSKQEDKPPQEDKPEVRPPASPPQEPKNLHQLHQMPEVKETTIRVNINRLDNVMNLVGELVLARNRLFNISSKLEVKYESDDLASALTQVVSNLNLVTTDLQLAVMKTRMQPVKKVFGKFPRMVRDLSREMGKEIELQIYGEETELDKSVIEEIGDPLVHLIRNSVDHGVETKEDRVKAGKNATGTIKLSAEHEGNYIVISVSDDGKGMDPDILKKKAVEKGVIDDKTAMNLSDKDALSLIFTPGFSTKDKATEISGRGVGMDVVKTNIQKINGIIEIESQIGQGSAVILKLPLTVAIIQTLIVGAGTGVFAVPLSSVVETLRIAESSIQTIDRHEVINLRKSVLSLLRLREEFGIENSEDGDLDSSAYKPGDLREDSIPSEKEVYVVVVALAEKKIGIMVDELYGQEEVVIKSLGDYKLGYDGISGATITGDGKVVLIIDVASMIESVKVR